jgi:hypothetical protein
MRARLSRLALLTFGALMALSCGSSTEPGLQVPTFTGEWQGRHWEGRASAFLVTHGGTADTLYLWGGYPVDTMYVTQELVRARVAFHGVGTYVLDGSAVGFQELIGGDVLGAEYEGTSTGAGILEITSYGGPNGVIEGTLTFDAFRVGSFTRPLIRFANGRFRASVKTQ